MDVFNPYLSARTLDVLSNYSGKEINILTSIDNLRPQDKSQFIREYKDFKKENSKIEIKDYSSSELHDRYILSKNFLIILGHGIKDLGNRDSFAIVLDKKVSTNIIESLTEVFDRRWKQSTSL